MIIVYILVLVVSLYVAWKIFLGLALAYCWFADKFIPALMGKDID